MEGQKDRKVGAAWDTIGRRKPGVSLAQARANFETLFAATRAAWPKMYRNDVQLIFQPFQDRLTGNVRTVLLILLIGVGCVLLIACANVANLLLARATSRQREIATRTALGASRFRLLRQLLTESLLISSIGGVAGILIAAAAVRALRVIGPEDFPRMAEVTVDFRVLAFALVRRARNRNRVRPRPRALRNSTRLPASPAPGLADFSSPLRSLSRSRC